MVKVNPKKCPRLENITTASILSKAIKKYFDDPEHLEAFEKWKAERDKKMSEIGAQL